MSSTLYRFAADCIRFHAARRSSSVNVVHLPLCGYCSFPVENIPLQAERHSARRQKTVCLPTGIAFIFERIPQSMRSTSLITPCRLVEIALGSDDVLDVDHYRGYRKMVQTILRRPRIWSRPSDCTRSLPEDQGKTIAHSGSLTDFIDFCDGQDDLSQYTP